MRLKTGCKASTTTQHGIVTSQLSRTKEPKNDRIDSQMTNHWEEGQKETMEIITLELISFSSSTEQIASALLDQSHHRTFHQQSSSKRHSLVQLRGSCPPLSSMSFGSSKSLCPSRLEDHLRQDPVSHWWLSIPFHPYDIRKTSISRKYRDIFILNSILYKIFISKFYNINWKPTFNDLLI